MSSSINSVYDNRLYFIFGNDIPFSEINDRQFKWIANWYDQKFVQKNSLPTATVTAKKVNDKIHIESIHIQFQNEKKQVFIPKKSSDDEFNWAMLMACSLFSLKSAIENQSIEGELLPGMPVKTCLKYISKKKPLYNALARNPQKLEFINWHSPDDPLNIYFPYLLPRQ